MLILLVPTALAQLGVGEDSVIVTQEQIDSVNFNDYDLLFTFNIIEVVLGDEGYVLQSRYYFLNAVYFGEDENGGNIYEVEFREVLYKSRSADFFYCALDDIDTDVNCFNTYVLFPDWLIRKELDEKIHRAYLKSLQTGGAPIIDTSLMNLLI